MGYTDKAKQLLNDLGNSPDDIADALHELGITGTIAHNAHCPLAHYLQNHIPYASVLTGTAFVGEDRIDAEAGVALPNKIALTTAQIAFIHEFDRGEYPDLVDPHQPFKDTAHELVDPHQ